MMPAKPILAVVSAAAIACGMGVPVSAWSQVPGRVPLALTLQPAPGQANKGAMWEATSPGAGSGPCTGAVTSRCAPSIAQAIRESTHSGPVETEQEQPSVHNQFQPVYRLHYGVFAWPAFPDPARVRTR